MPAPAVYILAVLGTVGAVLAFKEFVYEPHIVPAIDRWKLERAARAARRRRQAMEVSQDGSDYDLLMSETQTKSKGKPSDKHSDDDDSDDEDPRTSGTITGTSFMRNGLLIRRSTLVTSSQMDVELDNFAAHEGNPWRGEVPGQVLRQRKNASEHAMDESIQAIPYIPLSPSRTAHVVFDASAPLPSPPSSHIRLSSPPPPQMASTPSTGVTPTDQYFMSKLEMNSSPASEPQEPANPPARVAEPATSLPSPVASPISFAISSPPPEASPFQHMATQSALLGNASQLAPTFNVPSIAPSQSLQQSYHHIIPSLSQSYPQDLDYEHDLELLSPPSSRAESPFSLAALSPDHASTSRPLSAFSSAVSSPSPLRMGLGNHSYDAISPVPQIQLMIPHDNMSTTTSAQSTAYLSFAEDSSDDGRDDEPTQPYANLGARIGAEGTFRHTSAHAPPQVHYHPPSVLRTAPALGRAGSDVTLAPVHPEGQSLGLFPVPAREPRTPAVASTLSHTANASVTLNPGSRDPSYFRAAAASPFTPASPSASASSYLTAFSSVDGASPRGQTPPVLLHMSDSASELSDLDFMSDYQPSEAHSEAHSEISDLGEASDGSWSVASASGARAGGEEGGRPVQGGRLWRG